MHSNIICAILRHYKTDNPTIMRNKIDMHAADDGVSPSNYSQTEETTTVATAISTPETEQPFSATEQSGAESLQYDREEFLSIYYPDIELIPGEVYVFSRRPDDEEIIIGILDIFDGRTAILEAAQFIGSSPKIMYCVRLTADYKLVRLARRDEIRDFCFNYGYEYRNSYPASGSKL